MKPRVIIVSNRLPVSVKKTDGKLEYSTNNGGGLATGLAHYADDPRNLWVGWPGIASDELTEQDRQDITDKLRESNCFPVFQTKKQIDDFYTGYSNGILWPLHHDNPVSDESLSHRDAWFKTYRQVNQLFADAVLEHSSKTTTIWVHDYLLMLLPAMLRRELPNGKIGFFLHIPWPKATNYTKLADSEALMAGMLGADLVGMHTAAYVSNFLDTVTQLDSGNVAHKKVLLGTRVIRVTDFPIGIDYKKYEKARKSRAVTREVAKLRLQYAGLKMILTVDRLDPSKGLLERARAYREFLRENPKLHGKVVMVMLVVPSRLDVPEYKNLKIELESIIKATNEEFGIMPWTPVDYQFTALPFEQVTALYRRADVAFITPLRDGMNLVAKEYLASKPNQTGVLVLSKTAGAAQELKDAIMVDPRRPATLVKGLSRALAMKPKELKRRVTKMQKQLSTDTVQVWAGNFMRSLRTSEKLTTIVRTPSLDKTREAALIAAYKSAKNCLLLLDYDGCLVGFHRKPEDAVPTPELQKILKKLSSVNGTLTTIISGRTQADLNNWFGNLPMNLIAEHGAFTRLAGKDWSATETSATGDWQAKLLVVLEKYTARTPGSFVEKKRTALVWHYRQAKPYAAQKNLVILKRILEPLAQAMGLRVRQGHMILEIKPRDVNKGSSATAMIERFDPDFVLVIGDDYTDEDMFTAASNQAYTIKVGPGRTAARYRLKNVEAVLALLEKLSKA